MSLRNFIILLAITFGVAWYAVVIVPYFKMRNLQPIGTAVVEEGMGTSGVFYPKRAGRVANGAEVYAQNGCYECHTQLIRPTYAGNDLFRPDWAGQEDNGDGKDTRRETNAFDFYGEKYAQIGAARIGPDLSNVGLRVEKIYAKDGDPKAWLYAHLYNPRDFPQLWKSTCPPLPFLFTTKEIEGQKSDRALNVPTEPGMEVIPTDDAEALVSYLLSLKKDQEVPDALNFAPAK